MVFPDSIAQSPSRRIFLGRAASMAACLGLGDLGFLTGLRPVSAAEARPLPDTVRFDPDLEPLVRLIEDTPRDQLLEEVGTRIRQGLPYQRLLAALFLAGVRNIQPRPVGFKFHAVLVVHSAHLASLAAPDAERWLPIFWALDYFKSSQAADEREGDWSLRPAPSVPHWTPDQARQAFRKAMEEWDEPAADTAIRALTRVAGANEVFDLLCHYGARDFRDIGHKAIYVANGWRTLRTIGWRHAEPVLRSLVYALLDRGGDPNPAQHALAADAPGRHNRRLVDEFPADWLMGSPDPAATGELLELFRQGSAIEAGDHALALLRRGVAPQSLWDAILAGAGERLMQAPGIVPLHAVTSANALYFAWRRCGDERTRRFLLLQACAFMPLFRRRPVHPMELDGLAREAEEISATPTVEEILADIDTDTPRAARRLLAWLKAHPDPRAFMDAARLLVFFKGTNSHDYKFSSAVLEDYRHVSPRWRDLYLATSVFNLCGSSRADNGLVARTRAALATDRP